MAPRKRGAKIWMRCGTKNKELNPNRDRKAKIGIIRLPCEIVTMIVVVSPAMQSFLNLTFFTLFHPLSVDCMGEPYFLLQDSFLCSYSNVHSRHTWTLNGGFSYNTWFTLAQHPLCRQSLFLVSTKQ